MAQARTLTGARLVLYVNGAPYSLVTSFNFQSATPRRAIYALDSGEPYELAPTTTKVTGSIGLVRTIGDGGLEGVGLASPLASIPREKYSSILLVDRYTDLVVFQTTTAAVTVQSWEIPAKGIMTGTMQFEAIDWSNESSSH